MKRISISILSGILFPILYTVTAGVISESVLPQYKLDTMQVAGEPSMGLIFAPVAIPFWLYNYIHFYNFFGFRYFLDTIIFRTILILGFNIILYTFLTYFLLWYFGLFEKAKAETYQSPPLPPQSFN
jgi:hypothetical protein